MAELVFGLATGKYPLQITPATTLWVIVASDGSTYTTKALLLAAGKQPFPKSDGTIGLDLGMKLQSVTLSSVNGGVAGSPFYVAFNPQAPPSGTAAEGIQPGGIYFNETGHISQLWIALTASGDTIDILSRY